MDRQCSSSSALPLAWVLEVLAAYDKVELSVLLDMVKMAPDITDVAFRNVRELISLRILEGIFSHETSVLYNLTGRVGFDPSDRCEDVLIRILPGMRSLAALNMKAAGVDRSKWDVKPFIEYKRSCLPKSTLERVKDDIISGSHPSLVSLSERSGLLTRSRPGNDAPADSGDCNGIKTRPDRDELRNVLISPAVENTKHPLHGTLPSKRKRNFAAEITEGGPCKDLIVREDSPVTIMKAVKRYKADAVPCKNQAAQFGSELPNEKLNSQWQDHSIADLDKQGLHKCTTANKVMNKLDENTEGSVPNDDEAEKGNSCAGTDHYHNEMAGIANMKDSFLSFKCSLGHDSLAVDWPELKLCVKCNEGDNVLFCCSESCPLVIHESCLGLDASFDKDGKFYCPFCAYSQAFSAYQEARENAFSARNDLAALIGGKETKKRPTRSYEMSQDHLKGVEDLPKIDNQNGKDSAGAIYKTKLDGRRKSRGGKVINQASERLDETRSKKGVSGSAETELGCQHRGSISRR